MAVSRWAWRRAATAWSSAGSAVAWAVTTTSSRPFWIRWSADESVKSDSGSAAWASRTTITTASACLSSQPRTWSATISAASGMPGLSAPEGTLRPRRRSSSNASARSRPAR